MITGGGSGIGLALTQRFIEENNSVIICGRRESVLKAVTRAYPSVITKKCDLSDPAAREELFHWIQEQHKDLNVLINNAAIQQWMSLDNEGFFERTKKNSNKY